MSKRRKYDFEPGAVLIVEWHDAHSVDAWTGRDELDKKTEDALCRTIGFFQKTTHSSLVIAASVGIADNDDVAGVWVIPKGMIRSIEEVST